MSTERKGVEFFVGLFLLIGLGVVAGLVVTFGRAGRGLEKLYPLRVRFPNASGLVKGSDVLLSGARIGVVTQGPRVGRAGLRGRGGDQYSRGGAGSAERRLPDSQQRHAWRRLRRCRGPGDFRSEGCGPAGELINGQRTGGLDELTSKGSQLMDTLNTEILRKLSTELDDIKTATTSINADVLNKKNLGNLEDTLANLKSATEEFSKATHDLDLVVARGQETMDTAKSAMKTVDGAAGDLRLTLGDYRKVADSTRLLINKAGTGEGPLGMLIGGQTNRRQSQGAHRQYAPLRGAFLQGSCGSGGRGALCDSGRAETALGGRIGILGGLRNAPGRHWHSKAALCLLRRSAYVLQGRTHSFGRLVRRLL